MVDAAPSERARLARSSRRWFPPALAATLRKGLTWLRGARFRALLYHSVSDDQADPFAVPPRLLEDQLTALRRGGYQLVTLGEAVEQWRAGHGLGRLVAVTFDDALDDFPRAAMPVLRAVGARATLFVPVGECGGPASWYRGHASRRVLTADELRSAAEQGIELGGHGYRHVRLPRVADDDLSRHLSRARSTLDQLGAPRSIGFAYPYGDASLRERQAVRAAGFSYAALAGGLWGNGAASDPWALSRVLVTRQVSPEGIVRAVGRRADLARLWNDLAARRRAPRPDVASVAHVAV